jgi:hypothetical protein
VIEKNWILVSGSLLVIAVAFGLIGTVGAQEQSISLGWGSTQFWDAAMGGDCIQLGCECVIPVHITNTAYPECWYLPGFSFVIHDNGSGAIWTWPSSDPADALYGLEWLYIDTVCATPEDCIYDTVWFDRGGQPYNEGGHRLFGTVYREFQDAGYVPGADGVSPDYIGFAGITTGPLGLYYGLDNDVLALKFTPIGFGEICIDASFETPSYEWNWSPLAVDPGISCTSSDTQADWGGPYCYTVATVPELGPAFDFCDVPESNPRELCGLIGETIAANFCAVDPDPGEGPGPDDITLSVNFGTLDPEGNWSWTPNDSALIGSSVQLEVTASEADMCGDEPVHRVDIHIMEVGEPVQFTQGCSQTMVVGIGDVGELLFEAEGGCLGMSRVFSVDSDDGAVGAYAFVGNLLQFEPASADVGHFTWTIKVSAQGASDFCYISVVCVPDDCCGLFTGGYTGNTNFDSDGLITLGDITMLVNHVFISKQPLYCHAAGNANGDPEGNVTLSDITRLVDRVFISKGPTAMCQ